MEFIKNLPWGWIAGIAAVFIVGRSITSQIAGVKESVSTAGSNSTGMTPMFGVSAGGSSAGAGADLQPLGGDEWGVVMGDTGPSDAVLIQESNERVAKENIALQRYVADKSFQLLVPPTTNTNNTGNMGAERLPGPITQSVGEYNMSNVLPGIYERTDGGRNNLPNPNSLKVKTSDAVAFVQAKMNAGDYYSIYDQASKRGYSAAETAALINRAGVTAVGAVSAVSAADVNAWTREKGLAALH